MPEPILRHISYFLNALMLNFQVLISEVGLRNGLQSVKATMPTADKQRWIDALYAAGVR